MQQPTMTSEDIHGDRPISRRLDVAIAKARSIERPIAEIWCAPPMLLNLARENEYRLTVPVEQSALPQTYCGIPIIERDEWAYGWVAIDQDRQVIEGL